MSDNELIEWIEEVFLKHAGTYPAAIDYQGQIEEFWCNGCSSIFISKWPEWEKPTDDTFGHEEDCRFMKAKKLLEFLRKQ